MILEDLSIPYQLLASFLLSFLSNYAFPHFSSIYKWIPSLHDSHFLYSAPNSSKMKKKVSTYDKPSLEAALYGLQKRMIPCMPPIVLSDFEIEAPDNLRNSILLPHNGARARMYQMYKLIIPSLLTRPISALMEIDFEDLLDWWGYFEAFARCTCDVDSKVISLASDKIPMKNEVNVGKFKRLSLQFDEQNVIILPILLKKCNDSIIQFNEHRGKNHLRSMISAWKSLSNCLLKTYDIVENYMEIIESSFGKISFTGAEYFVTRCYTVDEKWCDMLEIATGFIKDDTLLARVIERNPSFEGLTCTHLNAITAQHFELIDGYITRLEDWEQKMFRAWLDEHTADRLLRMVRKYQNQNETMDHN